MEVISALEFLALSNSQTGFRERPRNSLAACASWRNIRTRNPQQHNGSPASTRGEVDAAREEAWVDTYRDDEQHTAFLTAIEDLLSFPFKARVLGDDVTVVGVEWPDDDGFGLDPVVERNGVSIGLMRSLWNSAIHLRRIICDGGLPEVAAVCLMSLVGDTGIMWLVSRRRVSTHLPIIRTCRRTSNIASVYECADCEIERARPFCQKQATLFCKSRSR